MSNAASSRMNRKSQRIELNEPFQATFGETEVTIIDLAEEGAAIEHVTALAVNGIATLRVRSNPPFEVKATVRHSVMTAAGGERGTAYRSGLAFRQVSEATSTVIETILMNVTSSLVRLWEANAAGLTSSPAIAAMQKRSASRAPSGYIWMRLVNGRWERTSTLDPNQPIDGFSVPAYEDRDQIALLCSTYETCSIAERQFLRALAQRAITETLIERKRELVGQP
jgi:hypothetical protein